MPNENAAHGNEDKKGEGGSLFDLELALERCFGNEEMLLKIVQFFYREMETVFGSMDDAIAKGDLAEAGRLGHRLKGTLVCLGAVEASRAARDIEKLVYDKGDTNAVEAKAALRVFERACEDFQEAMLRYRPREREEGERG